MSKSLYRWPSARSEVRCLLVAGWTHPGPREVTWWLWDKAATVEELDTIMAVYDPYYARHHESVDGMTPKLRRHLSAWIYGLRQM